MYEGELIMAFVSMIQPRHYRGNGRSIADTIKIGRSKQKFAKSGYGLQIVIGANIIENLGWMKKDRILVKWDVDTRECIIRRWTKEDKCPSMTLQPSGSGLGIRMTWYADAGMPLPESRVDAHGIEIKDHEIFFEFPPECFDYMK